MELLRRLFEKPALWAILCALGMTAYLTAAEIAPFLYDQPGTVASPIQPENTRQGDFIYYLSSARELAEWDISPEMPSNSEGQLFELIRLVPLLISALPFLVTDDIRFAFILIFAITGVGLAIPAYFISFRIVQDRAAAAMLTSVALIFAVTWTAIPFEVEFPIPNFSQIFNEMGRSFDGILAAHDKFALGDHFRIINPSLSFVVSFWFLLIVTKLRDEEQSITRWIFAALIVFIGVLLAFCYPLVMISSFFLLICAATASLGVGDWSSAKYYIGSGISIILLILLLGISEFNVQMIESSPFASRLYGGENLSLTVPDFTQLKNKYVFLACLFGIYAIFWKRHRYWIVFFAVLSLLISLFHMIVSDEALRSRLGRRGIDVTWVLLSLNLMYLLAAEFYGRLKPVPSRIVKSLALLLFFAVMSAPIIGQWNSSARAFDASGRRVSTSEFELFEYLKENFDEDTSIALLDWDHTQLISLFTDLDVAVSDIQLTGRTREAEMDRLIAVHKAFGRTESDFLADVGSSVELDRLRTKAISEAMKTPGVSTKYTETPWINQKQFQSVGLARYILRYQNLNDFAGIQILNEDKTISEELLNHLASRWQQNTACPSWFEAEVKLILVNDDSISHFDWQCDFPIEEIAQFGSLKLYQRIND